MNEDFFYQRLGETVGTGVLRGLLGLPLEQPLDRIKTHLQAHPENPSIINAYRRIYASEGFKGFYKGGTPTALRLSIKPIYRFGILLTVPQFYATYIPAHIKLQHPSLENWITSIALASFETLIVTPFESLKVWLMTNPNQSATLHCFFKQRDILKRLYRGWSPTFCKVSLSTLSFLTSYDFFRNVFFKVNPEKKQLSPIELLLISIPVGAINTAVIIPFDVVATKLQQANVGPSLKLIPTLYGLVKNYRFQVLARGWQIKFAQSIIQAAFTVPLLGLVQQHWAKEDKKARTQN